MGGRAGGKPYAAAFKRGGSIMHRRNASSSALAAHWRAEELRASLWLVPAVEVVAARAHITGSNRTLTQDISFGIDQLVEIGIRALSPAVNDTFTAMTCIDWLGDALCQIAARWRPARLHRDRAGFIRVITAEPSHERLVQRAFEKIRQASDGMPAVLIRLLDAITKIIEETPEPVQRQVLLDQAAMILAVSDRSMPEAADRADVRRRYDEMLATAGRAGH